MDAPKTHVSAPANGAQPKPAAGMGRRWTLGILVVALLFVLMPFLFWQSTWFGRPLTDEEITKDLANAEHPRKAQHALSQIADRIVARDPAVKRWYPQVIALASHKVAEIRVTAAWVMGQDNSVPDFRDALLQLLKDSQPMVRRNAALSLVRFGDASGRAEILSMLKSFAIPAPVAGTAAQRLKVGDTVNVGTLLGRVRVGDEGIEIRSPVPGTVERWTTADGAAVEAGDPVALIAPSPELIWESLRALVLIGTVEDLPEVERFIHPVLGIPDMMRQQAQLTANAIRSRAR
jgi:biotin carboxyl carrier protein